MDATLALSQLYAKHEAGQSTVGINIESSSVAAVDAVDHMVGKESAIKLATNAAVTVLRVSQIIMSKQASLKVPEQRAGGTMGAMDQDEAY